MLNAFVLKEDEINSPILIFISSYSYILCNNLIITSGTSSLFKMVQSAPLEIESYAFLISMKAITYLDFFFKQYSIIVFKLKIYNAQDLPGLKPY